MLEADFEAYWGEDGSWWDVEILESTSNNKYVKVHYAEFSEQYDEWMPVTHLRMRSRPCAFSHDYCYEIHPGIDVCVNTQHPDSVGDSTTVCDLLTQELASFFNFPFQLFF